MEQNAANPIDFGDKDIVKIKNLIGLCSFSKTYRDLLVRNTQKYPYLEKKTEKGRGPTVGPI